MYWASYLFQECLLGFLNPDYVFAENRVELFHFLQLFASRKDGVHIRKMGHLLHLVVKYHHPCSVASIEKYGGTPETEIEYQGGASFWTRTGNLVLLFLLYVNFCCLSLEVHCPVSHYEIVCSLVRRSIFIISSFSTTSSCHIEF